VERLHQTLGWIRTVTAGILIVTFGAVEEAVSDVTKQHGVWAFLLAVVVASALFRAIEVATESALENARVLRRWILGRHYIEGYWKQLTRDETGAIRRVSIVLIYFDDGRLKISGREFDRHGLNKATILATLAEYDDGRLRFVFESQETDGKRQAGVANYMFSMRGGAPLGYQGESYDYALKRTSIVMGERIVDPGELEACSGEDGDARGIATSYLGAE
jgi:hypothetical protein